ncbi:MAG: CDP-alcohol phosphatidyltransferase family protein [Bacteroidetes bacterium]|nr:CDP-alcohol phosphatidyltransferase family protein [Bacteroidota bacterium]
MSEKLKRLWATKNKNDEWWSSFVTSPLAIAVNYVVVDIKWLTPNLITLFSFITALASVVFIIIGGFINFIIAAVLIHLSHILDCMDGQMALYRGVSSKSGSYFDKLTDQIQVTLWFGAIGYAAYAQSQNVLPVFLAFAGVAFYSLRGYTKYVAIYTEMCDDKEYLEKASKKVSEILQNINIDFGSCNVLEDEDVRQGIKEFSNWPTIPQLYVDGKFVGGCDIVEQLNSNGELKKLLFN